MDIIIAIVVLWFGYLLLGGLLKLIGTLLAGIVRFWIVAFVLLILIVAVGTPARKSDTPEASRQRTLESPPPMTTRGSDVRRSPTAAADTPSTPPTQSAWLPIGGISVVVLWVVLLRKRTTLTTLRQRLSRLFGTTQVGAPHSHHPQSIRREGQPQASWVGLSQRLSRDLDTTQRGGSALEQPAGARQVGTIPDQQCLTIYPETWHQELILDFQKQHPWVLVDVPPGSFGAFLRECEWLQTRTGVTPSLADQSAILRTIARQIG